MRSLSLCIIALILFIILGPIGFIYSFIDGIFHPSKLGRKSHGLFIGIAIAIDQLGNVVCGRMFNDILIKKDGYKFGDEDETISSVIGKNKELRTLKLPGEILYLILDALDANHTEKAIEKF